MRTRALLLAALLAVPLVAAQAETTPSQTSVLVYHLDGLLAAPATPDTVPGTRVDGGARLHGASDATGAFTQLRDEFLARARTGAAATVELSGTLTPNEMRVHVGVSSQPGLDLGRASVHVALYEDDLVVDGRLHRFVVRAVAPAERVDLAEAARLDVAIPLENGWSLARLGVVAFVVNLDEETPRHRAGDVMQSASWTPRQGAPTVQERKAVLVEHVSTQDCATCAVQDEAVSLFARQYAAASTATLPPVTYLRPPSLAALVGLFLGAAVGVALVRRRA